VEFLIEFAWAALLVGVPIGIFTLALVWWALQGGHLRESGNTSALRREMQAVSLSAKKKKNKNDVEQEEKNLHPLQKKWAKFGGGFYGIVAFFTYIVVETLEVINAITHLGGFIEFIRQLNPDVIIQFFVGALLNFLTAIAWPVYWLNRIETDQVWLWFVVAYAGYFAGLKLAQLLIQRRSQVLT